MNIIKLVISNDTLKKYEDYYFSELHPRAKKAPIPHPYHDSMNKWMIMKRPMMNSLKQKWKEFIVWFIEDQGYTNLHIDRCEMEFTSFFETNRRHDNDNYVPKFIVDGMVESGFIVDDDCSHITKTTLMCAYDKVNPRTEIVVNIL